MRFDLDARLLESNRRKIKEGLAGKQLYVCMGDYLLLNAFCLTPAINSRLVGNSTTKDECLSDLLDLQLKPDVLFCTDRLEKGDGPSLIEKAKTYLPELKALIFIDDGMPGTVDKCVEARADGVMYKSSIGSANGDLVKAVRSVSQGNTYFPDDVISNITPDDMKASILNELSSDEVEILKFISDGNSNKEISKILAIREKTIKIHLENLLQKTGSKDRTQLAVLALKNQIVVDKHEQQ